MAKNHLVISIIFVLGGLILIAFVSHKAVKEAYRNRQIEKEIEILKQEAEKLRQDNKSLEEKIGYFETQEFQEWEAKKKLNFQKEDENVIVVRPSLSQEINEGEIKEGEVNSPKENVPNYKKWRDYFFKY